MKKALILIVAIVALLIVWIGVWSVSGMQAAVCDNDVSLLASDTPDGAHIYIKNGQLLNCSFWSMANHGKDFEACEVIFDDSPSCREATWYESLAIKAQFVPTWMGGLFMLPFNK